MFHKTVMSARASVCLQSFFLVSGLMASRNNVPRKSDLSRWNQLSCRLVGCFGMGPYNLPDWKTPPGTISVFIATTNMDILNCPLLNDLNGFLTNLVLFYSYNLN